MSEELDVRPDETDAPSWRERLKSPSGKVAVGVFGVWVVMTLLLLAFGIWWPNTLMPPIASDTAVEVLRTMLVFSVASTPVMALVWAIAYYSIRHWGHGGDTPPEDGPSIRGNNKVVIVWLLVSSLLCAFLLIWGLAALTKTTTMPPNAQPLVVKVIGQQWIWSFEYPHDGNIRTATLVVPEGRPVQFLVTSTDVIHSFWLPEMGIKVDANPLVTTSTFTTPSKVGTFNVRCAELCGLNHAYMQTTVTVMTPAKYNAWVLSQGGTPSQATATGASNG